MTCMATGHIGGGGGWQCCQPSEHLGGGFLEKFGYRVADSGEFFLAVLGN